jgi:hypothetical protein
MPIRAQVYFDRDLGQDREAERRALESPEQAVRLDSIRRRAAPAGGSALRRADTISAPYGVLSEQRQEGTGCAAQACVGPRLLRAHRTQLYYRAVAHDTARQRAELALAIRGEPLAGR